MIQSTKQGGAVGVPPRQVLSTWPIRQAGNHKTSTSWDLAKRPRSDTEASLPREGAPGFPSLEYGGQYAVPESRSLEPTVGGRYLYVADRGT